MKKLFAFRFVFVALMALVGASIATPSQAQGTIQLSVLKGGWVIGGSAGSGTLHLGGRSYPLSVGGLSVGLVFGGSATDFRGTVSHIRSAADIQGIYTAIGAGAAIAGGVRVITLRNARGVTLRLQGAQAGLMVNLDLSGMTIALR
jgi:lipid-binding SYLF domain-containing protein